MKKTLLTFTLLGSLSAFTQNFTLVPNSGIIPVQYSTCKFADVDGDGDLDLFAMGGSPNAASSRLYKNDGTGNFTLFDGETFIKRREGGAAFGDVNGDGFPDLIVGGSSGAPETKLYLNDGTGNYSLSPNSNFLGTMNGDLNMADFDNDGDMDILVTGMYSSNNFAMALYVNDGTGVFTRNLQSGLESYGMYLASVVVADLNGDGRKDIVTSSKTSLTATGVNVRIFLNQGGGVFTHHPMPNITAILGKVAVADVDNDGDQDLLVAGSIQTSGGNPAIGFRMELYYNDGNANFTMATGMPFIGIGDYLAIAFADVNNDGFQDILSMGRKYSETIQGNNIQEANLYLNDGTGGFIRIPDMPFTSHSTGNIVFADVDNDGDQDVLITGIGTGTTAVAKLYRNNQVLGVEEHDKKALSVYPNPVTNMLYMTVPNQTINTIEMYTLSGVLIGTEKTNTTMATLDCSRLSSGVYLVSVTTAEGNKSWSKIVKQ
ncbi:T9SS type A sorting domain-containing protein [Flavobacterium cerinum]|uniref:T9SS type A sorting domain-containing protein n=1 Tax=Flavobacterium cerinum TaxID=2502784 RepID=A0ABY5IRN8_9FLAO|nr:T9SS type A sorting domain-containing protein [Flavobacterium cerinum]UUC45508.1 T9SS type A sorting domain-containing protein [Flavobacterium cerinum]